MVSADDRGLGPLRALVVGAGMVGLATAHLLVDAGAAVTVVASRFGGALRSGPPAALWAWQPHHADRWGARERAWSVASYHRYLAMAGSAGVDLQPVTHYLDRATAAGERTRMGEVRAHVALFLHDPDLVALSGLDAGSGYVDAYSYLAPTIDTRAHLDRLTADLVGSGAVLEPGTVRRRDLPALARRHGAQVVVACCALDPEPPVREIVRTAWVELGGDGEGEAPAVRGAHCTRDRRTGASCSVVPSGGGLVVGATGVPAAVVRGGAPALARLLGHGLDVVPGLRSAVRGAGILGVDERAAHRGGVRLVVEQGDPPVVHHHGHGPAAAALAWGSAQAAVRTALQVARRGPGPDAARAAHLVAPASTPWTT